MEFPRDFFYDLEGFMKRYPLQEGDRLRHMPDKTARNMSVRYSINPTNLNLIARR